MIETRQMAAGRSRRKKAKRATSSAAKPRGQDRGRDKADQFQQMDGAESTWFKKA